MKVIKRAGRRPRRASPMSRSSFTAFVEQHVFLLMFGDGELSGGVQRAVKRFVECDEEAAETMKRAQRMVERARGQVGPTPDGEPVEQEDLLRYIKDNWHSLINEG